MPKIKNIIDRRFVLLHTITAKKTATAPKNSLTNSNIGYPSDKIKFNLLTALMSLCFTFES